MKLTNSTRMPIEVPKKGDPGSYESIPAGETRTITGVDKDHPKFKADINAKNIVEGVMTGKNMPEGTRTAVARPADKTDPA